MPKSTTPKLVSGILATVLALTFAELREKAEEAEKQKALTRAPARSQTRK